MAFKRKKINEEINKVKNEIEVKNINMNSTTAIFTEINKTTVSDANQLTEFSEKNGQNQNSNLDKTNFTNSMSKIRQKKRRANPDNWKQAVRKRLRQSGQEYVNANGKFMAKRNVKAGCGATCYLKCSERFTQEQRQTIHDAFWRLTDEQKNIFYWKYTSRAAPKRRRTKNESSKRSNTFHYRFEVKGEMLPVCSKFFFATLDVTARRIYYFYEHCYQEDTCMPRELRRGKNPKPTLPDIGERLNQVRAHIASFPSARLSGSSQKRYLADDLNLSKMYRLYAATAKNPLKQHWYIKVFNEEFNLGFRTSRARSKTAKQKTKNVEKLKVDNSLKTDASHETNAQLPNWTQSAEVDDNDDKDPIDIDEHEEQQLQQQRWLHNCLEDDFVDDDDDDDDDDYDEDNGGDGDGDNEDEMNEEEVTKLLNNGQQNQSYTTISWL